MITSLVTTIAVLIVIHRVLTAVDYFIGIPSVFYRIAGYIAYATTVFSIGSFIILRDEPIRILFIAFSVYWGIQAILDYLDYRYYGSSDNAEQETEQSTEKEEQSEKKEGR